MVKRVAYFKLEYIFCDGINKAIRIEQSYYKSHSHLNKTLVNQILYVFVMLINPKFMHHWNVNLNIQLVSYN